MATGRYHFNTIYCRLRTCMTLITEPYMATTPTPTSPLDVQVGGNHYKDLRIQPVEYIHANGIGYFEGNVIKYLTRWRGKNGLEDLRKARHYIDLLIALESGEKV